MTDIYQEDLEKGLVKISDNGVTSRKISATLIDRKNSGKIESYNDFLNEYFEKDDKK